MMMVLDSDSDVYVFGDRPAPRLLHMFSVAPKARAIAFHSATGRVIIASQTASRERSQVLLYSKRGNLERSIDIALEKEDSIAAATVTNGGRICGKVAKPRFSYCKKQIFLLFRWSLHSLFYKNVNFLGRGGLGLNFLIFWQFQAVLLKVLFHSLHLL